MAGERILIVDDDTEVSEMMKLFLNKCGYETVCAADGQQALKLAGEKSPDIIILDVCLPVLDGLEVCNELRRFCSTPILFLSGKGSEADKIMGLTAGGDDYITKPFSLNELVARIKAHLRRIRLINNLHNEKKETLMEFHGLAIDLASRAVSASGLPVTLSGKEFHLLTLMARHPNRVFTAKELYQAVWNVDSLDDARTVVVHIGNIRKKIEADPAEPKYIITVKGHGYKFNVN